jgi:pyridoxal phosphate enzyme (YggS family)
MNGFAERLESVQARISSACGRAGRNPEGVTLVAVAKTFGPDAVLEAADNGLVVIGESRIQEAKQKMALCPGHLQWHMVGHLQSNKCRDAVRLFKMIHSVDSFKLLEIIDAECGKAGVELPVCIEVNVSGERSKFGMKPEEVPALFEKSRGLVNVEIAGLMTIPPFSADTEEARPFFRRLREFRDQWRQSCGLSLDQLSMGMSHDFEVAIEEGATMIRLGSILFGERRAAGPVQGGQE